MAGTLVKSVRVSPELWAHVEAMARLKGTSANAWLVSMLEDSRGSSVEDERKRRQASGAPVPRLPTRSLPAEPKKAAAPLTASRDDEPPIHGGVAGANIADRVVKTAGGLPPSEMRASPQFPQTGETRKRMIRDGKSGAPKQITERFDGHAWKEVES